MSLSDWNAGRALVGLVPFKRGPAVRNEPMRFVRPAPVAEPSIEILMLETRRGAPTSTTVKTYEAGQAYSVPESLAKSFFSCGAADPAEAHAVAEAAEQTHADPVTTPRRRAKK